MKVGQVVMTRGVSLFVNKNKDCFAEINKYFLSYLNQDWGILCEEDKLLNDEALINGDRILAKYHLSSIDRDIYIITEWDRSYTTILFPEEY